MIVAVTAWRGTGATTTALLLAAALADDGPTWLIEADPAGGVLAGRVHLDGHTLGGLERVAFPTDAAPPSASFAEVAHHRGRLRIVTTPADPFRAHACHRPRVPWLSALRDLDGAVVIDIGRARAGGAAWPLALAADRAVVVTSPEVCASVATAEWVHALGRVSPADEAMEPERLSVVGVDQPGGVSFGRAALATEFGDRWAGWLPWEPATVDLVHRGALPDDRRLRRSALVHAAREVATAIAPSSVEVV